MNRSLDSSSSSAQRFSVEVSFYGDLGFFVKEKDRSQRARRILTHKTSVKDAIESFGVPHPEVDLIVLNGLPVDFSFHQHPIAQTVEVIERFELTRALAPFVRCLRCNGLLAAVSKETVIDHLKPLTRLSYNDFQRCPQCEQCYWRGSHVAKLEKLVESILNQITSDTTSDKK